MGIHLDGLCLRAGTFALDGLQMRVPTSGYAVLMGRTGCGKTTLLETVCGLKPSHGGRLTLAGTDVTRAAPAERGVGYVPQDAALFPTMTVREHLEFALRIGRWRRAERRARVGELAESLGLRDLLSRRPKGLSGGERQRVALGRALAPRPAVLCLDEPLSALDDDTREEIYGVLGKMRDYAEVTTLHVTHSRVDAARLADHVFRLDSGGIHEVDRGAGA